MTVAIVGANGRVGTELAVRLDRRGIDVCAVTRNRLGTHFLSRRGVDCRVADVSDPDAAADGLDGADLVVMAAYADAYDHEGFRTDARRTNERLIRNAVRAPSPGAGVVYLSSHLAHGAALGAPGHDRWSRDVREKRHLEGVLREAAANAGRPWWALRLGHVVGPNQPLSRRLRDGLDRTRVTVRTPPNAPSNVLHGVTLADAIQRCRRGRPASGVYDLTNEPQWRWRDVVEFYRSAGTVVRYDPPEAGDGGRSPLQSLLRRALEAVGADRQRAATLATRLPGSLAARLFDRFVRRRRTSAIADLADRRTLSLPAFGYGPMPGEQLPGLAHTGRRLARGDSVADVFEPEPPRWPARADSFSA